MVQRGAAVGIMGGIICELAALPDPFLHMHGPYTFVETETAWGACLKRLRKARRLAIDLEANSLYAYRESVCLLQISVSDTDYIIDPLAGFDPEGLGELLADSRVEKVFHACEYDLTLLQRQYGWGVNNLFDTMLAARVLGYRNMGLAGFLRDLYGVELSKKHQKANWAARPLTDEQLEYAQMDTAYLFQLRDEFEDRLREMGRLEEAREIFENATRVTLSDRSFDPDDFWSVKGARDLRPRELAVLRALYIVRDEEAQNRDVPPFKVLNNEALISLSKAQPQDVEALQKTPRVPRRVSGRMGAKLLGAIRAGLRAKPPVRKRTKRKHDPAVSDRFDKLMQWRKQQAQARDVESDVIITRETMWDIARLNPADIEALASIESLGPHRLRLHGESILSELKTP